jgi:hypothetical protein
MRLNLGDRGGAGIYSNVRPSVWDVLKDENFAHETVNFACAIATANRLKPAFVVITGDLTHQTDAASCEHSLSRLSPRLSL